MIRAQFPAATGKSPGKKTQTNEQNENQNKQFLVWSFNFRAFLILACIIHIMPDFYGFMYVCMYVRVRCIRLLCMQNFFFLFWNMFCQWGIGMVCTNSPKINDFFDKYFFLIW